MATRQKIFSNEFGAVYPDRVSFNVKKGWFSGGSVEDLAVKHITSVRAEVTRSPIVGALLIIVGLVMMGAGAAGTLVGLLIGVVGVVMIIGRPSVTINTAGNDLRRSNGSAFQRQAGADFAAAVKKALFAD